MPRFVILEHDFPALHWDLLIERDEILVSWRLPSAPRLGQAFNATESAPHRMHYLDYEGPVSGARGFVTRWDGGECVWLESEQDRVRVCLNGVKIAGELTLARSGESWRGIVITRPDGS